MIYANHIGFSKLLKPHSKLDGYLLDGSSNDALVLGSIDESLDKVSASTWGSPANQQEFSRSGNKINNRMFKLGVE